MNETKICEKLHTKLNNCVQKVKECENGKMQFVRSRFRFLGQTIKL